MELCQIGKVEINLYLINDRADDFVRSALFCIVGRSDEVHALLSEKSACSVLLAWNVWIVYSDGVSSEHLDDLHARHVGLSVSEIDHMWEWNPLLVLKLTFIDLLVVTYTQDSFVYLE